MDFDNMTLEEIEQLEKKISAEKEKKHQEEKGNIIEGFKITQSTINDKKGDKVYQRKVWQAYKYENGKNHVVYIGKDPTKAREKIQNYLKKHK